MFLSGRDPQPLEVFVSLRVYHQQPGLIFPCLDSSNNFSMAQPFHILPIHLPATTHTGSERPEGPSRPYATRPGVPSNIHQSHHQPRQQEECQLKFPPPAGTQGPDMDTQGHTDRNTGTQGTSMSRSWARRPEWEAGEPGSTERMYWPGRDLSLCRLNP